MKHSDFRRKQAEMDEAGFISCINRTGKHKNKRYEAIVNGQILKKYKTRASAKRLLLARFLKIVAAV